MICSFFFSFHILFIGKLTIEMSHDPFQDFWNYSNERYTAVCVTGYLIYRKILDTSGLVHRNWMGEIENDEKR